MAVDPDLPEAFNEKVCVSQKNSSISEEPNPHPSWTRWLDIVLRAAHVLVISMLSGGAAFQVPAHLLLPWQGLAMLSGAALIASEVAHRRHWARQGRGLMVYIHVGLFGLAALLPGLALACLLAALVVGLAGSHMPKRFRYGEFIHGRDKDLPEIRPPSS
jgi:hypothetical protein